RSASIHLSALSLSLSLSAFLSIVRCHHVRSVAQLCCCLHRFIIRPRSPHSHTRAGHLPSLPLSLLFFFHIFISLSLSLSLYSPFFFSFSLIIQSASDGQNRRQRRVSPLLSTAGLQLPC